MNDIINKDNSGRTGFTVNAEAIADAHLKASHKFKNWLESFRRIDVDDDTACEIYRSEFLKSLIGKQFAVRLDQYREPSPIGDIIDGIMDVVTDKGKTSLSDMAGRLRQRGYQDFTLSPLRLSVDVNGLTFSFENQFHGRILSIGDFYQETLSRWDEAIIDSLETIECECRLSSLYPRFDRIRKQHKIEQTAKDIMLEAAMSILQERLEGEEYNIRLIHVYDSKVNLNVQTKWGELIIHSGIDQLAEKLDVQIRLKRKTYHHDTNRQI